jgi:hypothetical protein
LRSFAPFASILSLAILAVHWTHDNVRLTYVINLSPRAKLLLYFVTKCSLGGISMEYVTTVRLLIQQSRQPLKNVKIELFDRDEHSPDDSLGVAHTNNFGEATFKYDTKDFADNRMGADDERRKLFGSHDTVPDLYPVVYNAAGQTVLSKRDEATRNKASLNILVLIDSEVAKTNGLVS